MAVGVDGEHEIVRRELARVETGAQGGEREEVRLRHPLVHVVPEKVAAIVAGEPPLDLGAGAVGGAVVDHHELVDEPVQLVEHGRDHGLFVVCRHDRDTPRRTPAVAGDRTADLRRRRCGHCRRYHSRVRWRPASKSKRGLQPSSVRARSLLTRLAR